jgi:hypothetical protein
MYIARRVERERVSVKTAYDRQYYKAKRQDGYISKRGNY